MRERKVLIGDIGSACWYIPSQAEFCSEVNSDEVPPSMADNTPSQLMKLVVSSFSDRVSSAPVDWESMEVAEKDSLAVKLRWLCGSTTSGSAGKAANFIPKE